jgi:hypothetical protein
MEKNERQLAWWVVLITTILCWGAVIVFIIACNPKALVYDSSGTVKGIDRLNNRILVEMKCTSHSSMSAIVHFDWEDMEGVEVGEIVYLKKD